MTPHYDGGYDEYMKFGQRGLDAYKAQSKPQRDRTDGNPDENTALKALIKEDRKGESAFDPPGLIKTAGVSADRVGLSSSLKQAPPPKESPAGIRKAARFLLLLGKEEAGNVLRNMTESEIEQITGEIASIKSVTLDEAKLVLEDFGYNIEPHTVRGGINMARDILSRAFGKEKGEQYIRTACPEILPHPFSFMNDLSLPQLLQILKDEQVESLSVILSFMDAEKVSAYIKTLDLAKQVSLVKRMAHMQQVHPDVIANMEGVLQERVHGIARTEEVDIDGPARLTEILRYMNRQDETTILREIEDNNPDISRQIKENLMTMESIFQLRPRDLQNLLLETANETIVLLLKDKEKRICEQILSHLSAQRRFLIEEERIIAPLVPRKDVQNVTREFLEMIRVRQEEGRYILLGEEDEYLL